MIDQGGEAYVKQHILFHQCLVLVSSLRLIGFGLVDKTAFRPGGGLEVLSETCLEGEHLLKEFVKCFSVVIYQPVIEFVIRGLKCLSVGGKQ